MVAQRMGRRTFVTHFRGNFSFKPNEQKHNRGINALPWRRKVTKGNVSGTEVFESKVPSLFNANKIIAMNIDIQKAKRALATLQEEKQAQQHRLQLAAQAKQQLDASRTQLLISNREL